MYRIKTSLREIHIKEIRTKTNKNYINSLNPDDSEFDRLTGRYEIYKQYYINNNLTIPDLADYEIAIGIEHDENGNITNKKHLIIKIDESIYSHNNIRQYIQDNHDELDKLFNILLKMWNKTEELLDPATGIGNKVIDL